MEQEIQELCHYLVEKLAKCALELLIFRTRIDNNSAPAHRRLLVGLAGIPASGKSTLALRLTQRINDTLGSSASEGGNAQAILVGLDGWHLTRAQLDLFPDPKLAHDRRGSHWTFDSQTYVDFVHRLREDVSGDIVVRAPSFDHSLKDPTHDATVIHHRHRIVILEGLYVFLSIQPWQKAGMLLDERWLIQVDPDLARKRLVERHVLTGVARDVDEANWRADENDGPNGQFLLANLLEPTRVLQSSNIPLDL